MKEGTPNGGTLWVGPCVPPRMVDIRTGVRFRVTIHLFGWGLAGIFPVRTCVYRFNPLFSNYKWSTVTHRDFCFEDE